MCRFPRLTRSRRDFSGCLDDITQRGRTPLHLACEQGHDGGEPTRAAGVLVCWSLHVEMLCVVAPGLSYTLLPLCSCADTCTARRRCGQNQYGGCIFTAKLADVIGKPAGPDGCMCTGGRYRTRRCAAQRNREVCVGDRRRIREYHQRNEDTHQAHAETRIGSLGTQ